MQCWHHAIISFSSRLKSTSTTKITFLKVRKTQKNIVMPMFTKCREHFFLNIHKMQRKHFYANCRCSQTVCQTAQQGGARQRGKGAKLNKRNLTFTISNFSIYTIFVITFGQYNWLMKDMWSDYCCRWLFFLSRRHDAIVSRKPPWQSLILLKFLCGLWGENKGS